MNILRRTAACWAAALALAAPAVAHSDPAGFSFLEIPAGARASALGGAYASRALGVEAAFWNPARASPQTPSSHVRSAPTPSGLSRQIRRVPSAWLITRPPSLRTRRCWDTAGRLIGAGRPMPAQCWGCAGRSASRAGRLAS